MYEYVKPAWMPRARPKLNKDDMKCFGANVAPRPLNPSQDEKHVFPVTGTITDIEVPRSVFYDTGFYTYVYD